NLVAEKGAGVLTERGDIHGLSAAVAALSADRENLADLIARAGQSASELTRERVFAHRSEIVKRELGKADV
ncbi:MAG: glycosyltransferase family 1 protein, partial [Pseudomonadota bacterium]